MNSTRQGRRAVLHAIPVIAAAALACVSAQPARADLIPYTATWSGAAYSNNARAVARIVIDDSLLPNPGESSGTFGGAVVSFDISVFGAGSGNGVWSTADFASVMLRIDDMLNAAVNWVGQAQPGAGNTWGDPASTTHDFNVAATTAGAPTGTGFYQLTSDGGSGDAMRLTSFHPSSAPGARVRLGDVVSLDLSDVLHEPPGIQNGETVKITGLPAGLGFIPSPLPVITGSVLGFPSSQGVKILISKGGKLLRSIPYNLAVEDYAFTGGVEVLLETSRSDFEQEEGIVINNAAPATPFPSVLNVSGVRGAATSVRVRLNGFTHTFPGDVDIFLMAPDGRVATVMSDAGSTYDVAGVDLVFDDNAAMAIPQLDQITSGTYRPANYGTQEPVPVGGTSFVATLTELADNGINGDWRLYVRDDLGGDAGFIDSWSLEFETTPLPAGRIKVTLNNPSRRFPNPGFTATLERRGQPRRSTRGFLLATGSPQTLALNFPATRTLPAASYELTLTEGSDLVSGTETTPGSYITARGFRLARPGHIPGGSPLVTLTLPPLVAGDGASVPGGIGHATGKLNSRALLPLRGLLGDAQPFTATLCLSQTHQAVVWATPYRDKRSYLGGILDIGSLGIPGRGASMESQQAGLVWRAMPEAKAKAYPEGFGALDLLGRVSRWTPTTKAEAVAQSLGLDFRGIDVHFLAPPAGTLPNQWSLRDNFTLLTLFPADAAPFNGRISGAKGTFNGRFKLAPPAANSPVSGALLQDAVYGSRIGQGLVKVPISAPVRGSYRTAGIELEH